MSALKAFNGVVLRRGLAGRKPIAIAAVMALVAAGVIFYAVRKNGGGVAASSGGRDAESATSGTAGQAETTGAGAGLHASASMTAAGKTPKKGAAKADAKPTSNGAIAGDRKQLKVRVIWKDTEQGVAGTSITIVQCGGNPEEIGGTAMTGLTGEAIVSFPMAWTRVHVQLRHREIASISQHVNCPPTTERLFKVERAAIIFGRVLHEDKRAAPGAKARLVEDHNLFATADAQGNFEIGAVPSGAYQLVASLGSFISDPGGTGRAGPFVEVKAGERKGPYDIILRPGLTLSG
ncbi:MAG: hypothetical protein NTX50_30325, partial [Candidatus Sumerlaeota bacterium]|nr:hypothetical protein [Candidatus Sumerlaeota bacterium]